MNNMSVRTRLYAVVAWLSVSLLLIATLGVVDLRSTNAVFEDVYLNRVEPLGQIKTVADLYAVNVVDTSHKMRDGALNKKEALDSYAYVRAEKDKQWGVYMATYLTVEEKQLADMAARQMAVADAALAKLEQIVADDKLDELRSFAAREMYPAIDPLAIRCRN